jgi:hypothetical protein
MNMSEVVVSCCDVRYDFGIKRFSARLHLQLIVKGEVHRVHLGSLYFPFLIASLFFSNVYICVCVGFNFEIIENTYT